MDREITLRNILEFIQDFKNNAWKLNLNNIDLVVVIKWNLFLFFLANNKKIKIVSFYFVFL